MSLKGAGKHRLYHYTSIGLVTLIPIALVAPSSVVLPVDLALGFLLPIHAHIGMAHIVEDYVLPPSCSLPSVAP